MATIRNLIHCLITATALAMGGAVISAPVPVQAASSALPPSDPGMPCADGNVSMSCDIRTMINVRGLPLETMWTQKRYDQLDQVVLALCTDTTRLPDGQPEALVFESMVLRYFDAWKDWEASGARLAAWRQQSPDSPAQALIEVMYWRKYAWHGRGNAYAHKLPQEARELFAERMAKADARLQDSSALAATCPLWHSLRIESLIDTGAPRVVLNAAYADGTRVFPAALQIHFAMLRSTEPKWGGREGDLNRFARNAVKLSQGAEGSTIYARLYWMEDCNCLENPLTFGLAGGPDWKLIKGGFEELLKRHPDPIYNRNKFASLACRANDKVTYAKLRRELGSNIVDTLWPSSWKVDVCDRRMTEKT